MKAILHAAFAAVISLRKKPPADAVAKIYVMTEKSVVTVPIALKDIVLP